MSPAGSQQRWKGEDGSTRLLLDGGDDRLSPLPYNYNAQKRIKFNHDQLWSLQVSRVLFDPHDLTRSLSHDLTQSAATAQTKRILFGHDQLWSLQVSCIGRGDGLGTPPTCASIDLHS